MGSGSSLCTEPWKAAKGEQVLGLTCGYLRDLCQSHVPLGDDRDVPTCHHLPGQQILLRALLGLCCDTRTSFTLLCPPLQPWALSQRQRGDPSRGAMGTVLPSPGGAAAFHAPLELSKQEHGWYRTCPCTALLSHSAPQTLGVPLSLIPARAVDAFQALQCAFVCSVFPGQLMPLGPDSPGSLAAPPALICTRLLPGRALALLRSSFGLQGGGDSRSWDKGTVTSMARAPCPLYGMGQARGQQLQEHGQDLECFWESAGAGRTCPIPAGDTDTEGTCCSGPTGTAGPSSPAALPGEGAPGSFLVLVNKSLLIPEAAGNCCIGCALLQHGVYRPCCGFSALSKGAGGIFWWFGSFSAPSKKMCNVPACTSSCHIPALPGLPQSDPAAVVRAAPADSPPSQGIGRMEKGEKSLGCLKSSWKCFSHLLLSAKTGLPLWHSISPLPALLPRHPKTTAPTAPAPLFGGCRDFPQGEEEDRGSTGTRTSTALSPCVPWAWGGGGGVPCVPRPSHPSCPTPAPGVSNLRVSAQQEIPGFLQDFFSFDTEPALQILLLPGAGSWALLGPGK